MTLTLSKTTIPFSGFYETMHSAWIDDLLERELEYAASDHNATDDQLDFLSDMFTNFANFRAMHLAYARLYTERFNDFLKDECGTSHAQITFDSLHSPKGYNFTTDTITATIPTATLMFMFDKCDKNILARLADENCSHRDGFISYMDADSTRWGEVYEWEHEFYYELLIRAFIETRSGKPFDYDTELRVMEDADCNGEFADIFYTYCGDKFKTLMDSITHPEQ
jgi:hypothetical protein